MLKLKLLPILVLLSSCYHSDPEPNDRPFLISGNDEFGKTWRISQIEIELGTLVPKTCVTDNFITYFPNGNYEINEGATKCDPNDPPAIVGTWEMNSFETKIFVTIEDSLQVWTIESVDRATHRISSEFQEGDRIYSLSTVN